MACRKRRSTSTALQAPASFGLAMLVATLIWPLSCSAQTAHFAEKARDSIVYIFFDTVDQANGVKTPVQGTGFIVSPGGYVLTASHLFRAWRKQTDAHRRTHLIKGSRYDKPGYTKENWLVLDVINLGDSDAEDVALLKFPQLGSRYEPAPICLDASDRMKLGDSLLAYGFPEDQNFQPVPGILGTQNAAGGRWAAAIAFTDGMSGGPVYNADGFVIGIVKGGLGNTDAVRFISPIRHAFNYLMAAGLVQKCDAVAPPKKEEKADSEDILWTFVQEDFSLEKAQSF